MLRSPLALFLGLFVLALGITAFVMWLKDQAAARWVEAEAHLIDNLATLSSDAKGLIDARLVRGGEIVEAAEVPDGLLVPRLEFAEVFPSHVNLVLYTSPDVKSGYRVWIAPRPDDYEDGPTALPFVGRFSYLDDEPVSPSNRP